MNYVVSEKRIPRRLTVKQRQAVGALLMWLNLRGNDKEFNKFMAIGCIKMQTYFDTEIVG